MEITSSSDGRSLGPLGILLFGLLFGVAQPCSAKTLLTGIPLEWRPTQTVTVPPPIGGPATATIGIRTLVDRRPNPEKIAENLEDASEGKILPVTTRDEVGAWATARLTDLMTQGGYPLVNDANAKLYLSGEVLQFFVTETDTYKAEVSLRLTLTDANGNVVWSGTGSGHDSRAGRSYKADNYCEMLSDTLLIAVQSLLQDPKFQRVITEPVAAH